MDRIEIVREFLKYKYKIEEYGFNIDMDSTKIRITRKLNNDKIVIVSYLNDPIALQGFVQGLECLICNEGDGRMDHITKLIEDKWKDKN